MSEEKIEEAKKQTLEMLTRKIFGIPTGSLETAKRDIYLWKCFIRQIKEGILKS